jgi:hypothetical protein
VTVAAPLDTVTVVVLIPWVTVAAPLDTVTVVVLIPWVTVVVLRLGWVTVVGTSFCTVTVRILRIPVRRRLKEFEMNQPLTSWYSE